MADNVTSNPGTGGVTWAADDISGVFYARNKLIHGADGVNAGDVSTANPFPVQLRNTSGTELGTAAAPVRVDPTGTTTQPVSAASLPLPSGAATAANQSTANTALAAIQTAVELIDNTAKAEDAAHASGDYGVMTLVVRNDTRGTLAGTDLDYAPLQVNASGDLRVDGSAVTQPISAASLPLPSGAATAAHQLTIIGHVDGLEGQLNTGNTALAAIQVAAELLDDLVQTEDAGHATGHKGVMTLVVRNDTRGALAGTDLDYAPLQVNASGDLRVDGSAVTQPVSAASLPLPTGAATSANQATANTALSAIQAAVELIDNTVSGSELQVDVVASLPAGTNAIGKLAANSGVDIGDVDITSVVPGTGATNLGKVEDAGHASGDVGVMTLVVRNDTRGTLAGTDLDYAPLQVNASGDLRVDGSAVTQPISAASLPLPAGAATAANQATGNTALAAIQVAAELLDDLVQTEDAGHASGHKGVMTLVVRNDTRGALAGTDLDYAPLQVNASGDLRVDGSAVTQPISAASLPLPSGAATAANQSTANTALAAIQTAVELLDNTVSGSELQVDVVASLPAGTNAIGKLAANSGVDIGDVDVTSIAAGTNLIGFVGLSASASATGTTPYFDSDADNSVQTLKGSAGVLHSVTACNPNATDAFLQLYDESGAITVGTTTPKYVVPIPKGDGVNYGVGDRDFLPPLAFANSIKYAVTTTPTGSGDPTTGITLSAAYK